MKLYDIKYDRYLTGRICVEVRPNGDLGLVDKNIMSDGVHSMVPWSDAILSVTRASLNWGPSSEGRIYSASINDPDGGEVDFNILKSTPSLGSVDSRWSLYIFTEQAGSLTKSHKMKSIDKLSILSDFVQSQIKRFDAGEEFIYFTNSTSDTVPGKKHAGRFTFNRFKSMTASYCPSCRQIFTDDETRDMHHLITKYVAGTNYCYEALGFIGRMLDKHQITTTLRDFRLDKESLITISKYVNPLFDSSGHVVLPYDVYNIIIDWKNGLFGELSLDDVLKSMSK